MEACPQMKYELVVKWKEDKTFHIMAQKDKVEKKIDFDIPNLKFQNRLELKTSVRWNFLQQTGCLSVTPSPPNARIFADS